MTQTREVDKKKPQHTITQVRNTAQNIEDWKGQLQATKQLKLAQRKLSS